MEMDCSLHLDVVMAGEIGRGRETRNGKRGGDEEKRKGGEEIKRRRRR